MTTSPWILAGAAIAALLLSTAGALLLILRLPPDHFAENAKPRPLLRRILANVAGALLLVVGVVLSLPGIPGPGLVLAVVGLSLVDLPGKRGLERRIVRRPRIRRTLNKVRARFGRPLFLIS